MVRLLCVLTLWSLALTAHAVSLRVSADHNPAELGDVISLEIELDGLRLYDTPPAPDFKQWLGEHFQLLASNQSVQLTDHNGQMHHQVLWSLQLLPRKTGTITLPSLKLAGAVSQPVTLTILPMPEALKKQPTFHFYHRFDPDSLYVQQMGRYTLRLAYQGELINGVVSPPVLPDARLLRLTDQLIFRKVVGDTLYTVFEWRYAVFPQKAGAWQVPEQTFNGQLLFNRRLRGIQAQTQALRLQVKPIPSPWPANHLWLPVRDLTLTANWKESDQPHAGDTLQLEVILRARGIRGAQLPDIQLPPLQGVRVYAEPPQSRTLKQADDLIGERIYRWNLLLEKPGDLTFPALRLPWWDVAHDRLRWAEVPARTMHVLPSTQMDTPTPVANPSSTKNEALPTALWPWQLATLVFGLTTLGLLLLLWRTRHRHATGAVTPSPVTPATKKDKPCALPPHQFYQWLLREATPAIREDAAFAALEQALFHTQDGHAARQAQAGLCQRLNRKKGAVEKAQKTVLNELYPVQPSKGATP